MKKIITIFIVVLILMEGISWWVGKSSSEDVSSRTDSSEKTQISSSPSDATDRSEEKLEANQKDINERGIVPVAPSVSDSESFPAPSTEVVNGVTERTFHVGVRQFEWDPRIIRAKQGELVRLVIHNADVKHGLVIPDLGVNEDIPPEGAVIEFMASKKGTFTFFCSVYCGEGHMEMQGSIVIE